MPARAVWRGRGEKFKVQGSRFKVEGLGVDLSA